MKREQTQKARLRELLQMAPAMDRKRADRLTDPAKLIREDRKR
jgi:hypothetical protein